MTIDRQADKQLNRSIETQIWIERYIDIQIDRQIDKLLYTYLDIYDRNIYIYYIDSDGQIDSNPLKILNL